MTCLQQCAVLQRKIWKIANEVRGAVNDWDFKKYVLGSLFYHFIRILSHQSSAGWFHHNPREMKSEREDAF